MPQALSKRQLWISLAVIAPVVIGLIVLLMAVRGGLIQPKADYLAEEESIQIGMTSVVPVTVVQMPTIKNDERASRPLPIGSSSPTETIQSLSLGNSGTASPTSSPISQPISSTVVTSASSEPVDTPSSSVPTPSSSLSLAPNVLSPTPEPVSAEPVLTETVPQLMTAQNSATTEQNPTEMTRGDYLSLAGIGQPNTMFFLIVNSIVREYPVHIDAQGHWQIEVPLVDLETGTHRVTVKIADGSETEIYQFQVKSIQSSFNLNRSLGLLLIGLGVLLGLTIFAWLMSHRHSSN